MISISSVLKIYTTFLKFIFICVTVYKFLQIKTLHKRNVYVFHFDNILAHIKQTKYFIGKNKKFEKFN